jgi:hypothetical protein
MKPGTRVNIRNRITTTLVSYGIQGVAMTESNGNFNAYNPHTGEILPIQGEVPSDGINSSDTSIYSIPGITNPYDLIGWTLHIMKYPQSDTGLDSNSSFMFPGTGQQVPFEGTNGSITRSYRITGIFKDRDGQYIYLGFASVSMIEESKHIDGVYTQAIRVVDRDAGFYTDGNSLLWDYEEPEDGVRYSRIISLSSPTIVPDCATYYAPNAGSIHPNGRTIAMQQYEPDGSYSLTFTGRPIINEYDVITESYLSAIELGTSHEDALPAYITKTPDTQS